MKTTGQYDVIDCEKSCLSSLMPINGVKYCNSLLAKEGLFVEGRWLVSVHRSERNVYNRYKINLETEEIRMSRRDCRFELLSQPTKQEMNENRNEQSEFISVDTSGLKVQAVIDVSNNGMRWEGCCLNDSPFGYGALYNESNRLVYRGVMINDKKECFGIQFYPDLGVVEYCGGYCNNQRHGFGMLYDRKGDLLYEGGFLYGLTEYKPRVILSNIDDDNRCVHSLIRELVIQDDNERRKSSGRGKRNDHSKGFDLQLCGFVNLERIVVKKNSLKDLNSLTISDNPVLKSVEIENAKRGNSYRCGAFRNVKSVIITSMIIENCFI